MSCRRVRRAIASALSAGFLLYGAAAAGAQQPAQTLLETATYTGAIWRHSPLLTTRTGRPVYFQEFALRLQTSGRRPWQAWQRYPAFGIAAGFYHLGEGSHRRAWALFPYVEVPLLRSGRWVAAFRLGTGLARVARPFHIIDNPGQNAIGSYWNNLTQFRLGAWWRCSPQWQLGAGFSLNHLSNGGSQLPNFGINAPAGYLGLLYSPRPQAPLPPAEGSKRASGRRLGVIAHTGLAVVEARAIGGPKYFIRLASLAGYYRLNRVNRVLAGLDWERNDAHYRWALHTMVGITEAEARRGSTHLAVFAADEFLFGPLGIQLQLGYYVGRDFNRYVGGDTYTKLGLRGYLPPFWSGGPRLHAGIGLKAHGFSAEYIAGQIGVDF
jgi:hypothetical protein